MANLLKNRIFLIILGIILLFVVLNFVIPKKYFLNPLRNFSLRVLTPITRVFYRGGDRTSGFFANISQIRRLSDEKSELERKNAKLEVENSKLKELEKINEILRAELGLKQELKNIELAEAEVIGRSPTNLSGSYILNKGSRDGLKEGMPVVSEMFLLGKLTEVDSNFSRVTLIVDQSSVVNVEVEETRATGILRGEVGFNLKIESVPQESKLKVGQRIITSGLGGTMPKGLIVGEIAEVVSSSSEIFQEARVKPAANFNHLEMVFIIKN